MISVSTLELKSCGNFPFKILKVYVLFKCFTFKPKSYVYKKCFI